MYDAENVSVTYCQPVLHQCMSSSCIKLLIVAQSDTLYCVYDSQCVQLVMADLGNLTKICWISPFHAAQTHS